MIESKKGFIGAIGDDLPSLIPIFIGLMIFFAVFLNVFNDYNAKNKMYGLNQEAIEISMQLKSDPVIISRDHFLEKCNKINSTKRWMAFLVDLPLDTISYQDLTLDGFISDHEDYVLKTIDDSGDLDHFICNENYLNDLNDKSIRKIDFLYPITVQRDSGVTTPARLYILIWE
jgi:hypothetical protein